MNYYPFHIGDYASATRHLSWDEDAAYRRLLDVYYTTEQPLPEDLRSVCRLVLATTEAQREAVKIVLEEFFDLTSSGWVNHRADEELYAMRCKQQMQRDKANKRWHKPATERGIPDAQPEHQETNATAYATAQNNDAEAMPPTPTPTPIKEQVHDTRSARFNFRKALIDSGVPDLIADDWIKTRKAKKLTGTETAYSTTVEEAGRANLSVAEAVTIACRNGWGGFKASWLKPEDTAAIAPTGQQFMARILGVAA